ncbi:MAG: LolA family protein [Acidimicrobiales bacterium]
MSELGDLLELLHGANGRWQTVHAVSRRWTNAELMRTAKERHAERQRAHGSRVVVGIRGHGPATSEYVTRTWVDRPRSRTRTETENDHGPMLNVRDGNRWWWYSPMSGATVNEDNPDTALGMNLDPLLDPVGLIEAFEFTVTGAADVAGRTAVTAVATPRAEGLRRGFGAFTSLGADEVHLAVDRERGVLLRTEARLDGRTFDLNEVLEGAFDEVFDGELFRFVSPDGSPARSARESLPPPEHLSMEEAARRASFTVLAPSATAGASSCSATTPRSRSTAPTPGSAAASTATPSSPSPPASNPPRRPCRRCGNVDLCGRVSVVPRPCPR